MSYRKNIAIGLVGMLLLGWFMAFNSKTLPLTQSELRWAQKIESAPEGSLIINSDNTIFAKITSRLDVVTFLQYVEKTGLSGSGQVGTKSLTRVAWIVTPEDTHYSDYEKEYNHLVLRGKENQV